MVNVLIPITDKKLNFNNIISRLQEQPDVNILVGVTEELYEELVFNVGESENLYIAKFQNGADREEIINALQRYIGVGTILIMRKPITLNEFENFISSKKDIVTCKNTLQKFKSFLIYFWQNILKLLLGVKQYDGNPSVIYFNEDTSAVLSTTNNLSFASRANRWRGIKQETVEVKGNFVKPKVLKKDIIIYSIVILLSLLIGTLVTTFVCIYANVGILSGILLVCLDLICVAVALIMSVLLLFNILVGKKNFGTAIEIKGEEIYQEDDDYDEEFDETEELDEEDFKIVK